MKVIYHESAKQWGEGFALLRQATKRLEEVAGSSSDRVSAEWERKKDPKGRLIYSLRLSDWTGAVSAEFRPEELDSGDIRYRMIRLWGDLLQARSHRQLEQLTGANGPAGE